MLFDCLFVVVIDNLNYVQFGVSLFFSFLIWVNEFEVMVGYFVYDLLVLVIVG